MPDELKIEIDPEEFISVCDQRDLDHFEAMFEFISQTLGHDIPYNKMAAGVCVLALLDWEVKLSSCREEDTTDFLKNRIGYYQENYVSMRSRLAEALGDSFSLEYESLRETHSARKFKKVDENGNMLDA
jgi:hypothetical protein